jgi:hypothetical protein
MPSRTDESAAHRAARLMSSRHPALARAIARQLARNVPRYKEVASEAVEHNVLTLLSGLQKLLERGTEDSLRRVVEDIAQLRSATGFQVDEIVTAGLCFLPVLRRYLVRADSSLEAGLEAYEALESLAIPMFGYGAAAMTEEDHFEATDPSFTSPWSDISFPMSIEDVEDEEVTDPGRRRR